jgi:hypothetical protein
MADVYFGGGVFWRESKSALQSILKGVHALSDPCSVWHSRTNAEPVEAVDWLGGWWWGEKAETEVPLAEWQELLGYIDIIASRPEDFSTNWVPEHRPRFGVAAADFREKLSERIRQLSESC